MLKKGAKLLFLLVAPAILALTALALALGDLVCRMRLLLASPDHAKDSGGGNGASPANTPGLGRRRRNASIVIPSWNGRDLLEKYLPSVIAATFPDDEIIVVDNASSDGSADLVAARFPRVRLIRAERNLGFGGGSNRGIQSARHPTVVLLNNDMRVTPEFLRPLLDGFTDDLVFAVSAQIFFSDPDRRREETGLTSGSFEKGFVRVRHEVSPGVMALYPTFYAGGGSTAYDREKFLALGGFDALLEPFYLEDTDLSYCAWRRGWKVLYQPASHVFHEHRATIGKHFSRETILAYLQKNYVLMVWKNIHRWRWLAQHFAYLYGHMVLSWLGRTSDTRTSIGAFLMALKQLPQALRQRHRARVQAAVSDGEAFRRTRPSVFRDVFPGHPKLESANRIALSPALRPVQAHAGSSNGRPLNILFVSPYSIYPPIHGGAVFMLEAIRQLALHNNVYVLTFVDRQEEVEANLTLEGIARKVDVCVRQHRPSRHFSLRSHSEETFWDPEFAARLDRSVYQYDIDVIQFEYTQLAQYHLPLEHTSQCLFEHDVHFHSVGRQLMTTNGGCLAKARELLEWLRVMRYEIRAAEKFDAIFTCHENEQRLLESYLSGKHPPVVADARVAVDVSSYSFPGGRRDPDTMLFVGNFQHKPNVEGLLYFCHEILPLIRARRPSAKLCVVGARTTPAIERLLPSEGVHMVGQVADIREPLSRHAVFVCPIRMGAGLRVKILEAFASGIPVVSTSLGAEGIRGKHGTHYLLADSPAEFAEQTLYLLDHPEAARAIAAEGRRLVEALYDWPVVGARLESIYRELVANKARPTNGSRSLDNSHAILER